MYLEAFLWCWVNWHPYYSTLKLAKLLAMAALILVPLLFVNVDLALKGHPPVTPRLELGAPQNYPGGY
jgi:hypothetical protein